MTAEEFLRDREHKWQTTFARRDDEQRAWINMDIELSAAIQKFWECAALFKTHHFDEEETEAALTVLKELRLLRARTKFKNVAEILDHESGSGCIKIAQFLEQFHDYFVAERHFGEQQEISRELVFEATSRILQAQIDRARAELATSPRDREQED
jgi:hypothetical protein